MRWSLILSTFIVVQSALSFGCVALAIPPSSDELERRARTGARVSSKTYRKNSENHAYAYKFDQTGGVTREKLKEEDRPSNGKKRLMIPHTDADHVFEHQMFEKHLFQEHGLKFNDLHKDLRKEVTSIMNGAGNMAPVPSDVNRGVRLLTS
ncbi:hypothetical protein BDZ97DRAFT_1838136 [Flammula alnicola]|nr:hypothetical protein BDZ97DRAFT_1838136 [Flammula alnicola]